MMRQLARRVPAYVAGWAVAWVLAGLSAGAGCAEDKKPEDNPPLQVQAESGIEWQQNAQLYIARGNAVAIRGPVEVRADTLIAHYREIKPGTPPAAGPGGAGSRPAGSPAASRPGAPVATPAASGPAPAATGPSAGGNTEIYRVEAEGHVRMTRDGSVVVGDRAVYDIDQALLVVTGKGLKLTTATDVVTARDTLEWYDQKQIAVARGDAVAVRTGKTIKADILTAYMVKTTPPGGTPPAGGAAPNPTPGARSAKAGAPQPAKPGGPKPGDAKLGDTKLGDAKLGDTKPADSKISRLDAQGHVVVTNGPDTGRGDYGVYNADSGICTLIDHVVITRGNDVIKGQYGVMDLVNNVNRMMPALNASNTPRERVQGLFVRQDQGTPGTGGTAPAPGAAPGTAAAPARPAAVPGRKP